MARDLLDIQAKARPAQSKGQRGRLRKSGEIPGVLYGRHVKEPIPLSIEEKTLKAIFKSESKHMAILKMDVGGQVHTSILKSIGRDPVTLAPIHLDFQTVDLNEKAKFTVGLALENTEAATKVDLILQQPCDQVEIECLPLDCPLVIKIDVSKFARDGAVAHVRDLPVGAGVRVITSGEDPVLVVQAPAVVAAPVETAAPEEKGKGKGKGKK